MIVMDYRTELIKSACILFSQRGYDAVGVQELVDSVGVTKPTLYHYFGSKQGVLEAIFLTYLKPFGAQLTEKCIYHHDIVKSLEDIARHYFDFARTEPGFFRLWMSIRISPPQSTAFQSLSSYLEIQHRLISNLFIKAAEHHGNLRGKQEMLATSFIGLLYIYATDAIQGNQKMDENMVYQIVHQFMYGIFS
ncbi:MAG: TetR/AcrR family transcriptional regulator [Chloroflexi bacterium HGW-Chloroflexi-8]|nr:MAG: TetR/AcrR family transcriptional regulator [Chloroflexi bacterium HGW-Chloroflexi-8]